MFFLFWFIPLLSLGQFPKPTGAIPIPNFSFFKTPSDSSITIYLGKIDGYNTLLSKFDTTGNKGYYTNYKATKAGSIGGSGIKNYIPKFTGTNSIGKSLLYNSDAGISIGDTSPPHYLLTLQSTAETEKSDTTRVGPELLTALGWDIGVGYGWTGNYNDGFNYINIGQSIRGCVNTEFQPTIGETYKVSLTISNYSGSGYCLVNLGSNISSTQFKGNQTLSTTITALSNVWYFAIIPQTTFVGTIAQISIKRVESYEPTFAIKDHEGTPNFEIRSSIDSLHNTFIGKEVGKQNTSGYNNTAIGYQALKYNKTGFWNTAVGWQALFKGSSNSYGNLAIGPQALLNNNAAFNLAIGPQAMLNNINGVSNIAIGSLALGGNMSGYGNTVVGYSALLYNVIFPYNTVLGYMAGNYLANGMDANRVSQKSIYIGANTRSGMAYTYDYDTTHDSYEIVIGNDAIGHGNNTATLGNDSIKHTYLRGVNLAPMTLVVSPLSGNLENDGDSIYYTNSSNIRKALGSSGGSIDLSAYKQKNDSITNPGYFTNYKALSYKQKSDSIVNAGYATNYKLLSYKQKSDSIINAGYATNYKLLSYKQKNDSITNPGYASNYKLSFKVDKVAGQGLIRTTAKDSITTAEQHNDTIRNAGHATIYDISSKVDNTAFAATERTVRRDSTNWNTAYTHRITTLTTNGSSGNATLSHDTLNVPSYTGGTSLNGTGFVKASGTNITYDNSTYNSGSGTTNYLTKFTGTNTLGNSLMYDNGTGIGIGTNTPSYLLTTQSTVALEEAAVGTELLTTSGWTTTGWTGTDPSVGFTHTAGNTNNLSNTLTSTASTDYKLVTTITNCTTGNIQANFAGQGFSLYSSNGTYYEGIINAYSTSTFYISPSSNFNGTVVMSLKKCNGSGTNPVYVNQNHSGISNFEIRSSPAVYPQTTNGIGNWNNVYIGKNAGKNNVLGWGNVAIGEEALKSNDVGYLNIAIGPQASQLNIGGKYNIAIGYAASNLNHTGSINQNNIAIGSFALAANYGYEHIAIGLSAAGNCTASSNGGSINIGSYAGYNSGNMNVVMGYSANYRNQSSGNSYYGYNVILGHYALNQASNSYNNVVIGDNAAYNYNYYGEGDLCVVGYHTLYSFGSNTGNHISAFGTNSLLKLTSGAYMTAIGDNAGSYIANGSTSNLTADNGVYLGANTKAKVSGGTNEIVIGYNTIGNGSNTTVIGNSSVTGVYLGSSTPAARLYSNGVTFSAGTNTSAPITFTAGTNLTNAANGNMEYDGTNLYFTPSANTRKTITYTSDIASKLDTTNATVAMRNNWTAAYNNEITTLTTTGTSGAATLNNHTLNIPQYSGGGGGSMVYPDAGIAVSTGAAWAASITNNSSNWNTAYGWGNHASAGYLTASSLSGYATQTWVGNQGYLANETDPTIYSWAKASTKPSYSWSEISSKPTNLSSFTNDLGNYGGFVTGTPWTSMGYVTGTPWTSMGYVTGTPWTALGYITAASLPTVNDGSLSLGVSGSGISGSASFSANQAGTSTFTVTSNATTSNSASTIVLRDGSGYVSLTGYFCSPSDIRLKKNIRPLNAADYLKARQIDFHRFEFRVDSTNHAHVGVIAQELEQLFPEFVSVGTTGKKEVNYIEMLVMVVAQQKDVIEKLEKRVSELEEKTKFGLYINNDKIPRTFPALQAVDCTNSYYDLGRIEKAK